MLTFSVSIDSESSFVQAGRRGLKPCDEQTVPIDSDRSLGIASGHLIG